MGLSQNRLPLIHWFIGSCWTPRRTSRGDEALRIPQDQEEQAAADLAVHVGW